MRLAGIALLVSVASCAFADAPDVHAQVDGGCPPVDAPARRCSPDALFGPAMRLANVNSPLEDLSVAMTREERKAYFVRSAEEGGHVLLTSRRGSMESNFPAPTTDPALAAVTAGPGDELYLSPTADDLAVYYRRDQTWFVSSRLDPADPFSAGTEVYANGERLPAHRAMISADSQTLYWSKPNEALRAGTRGEASHVFIEDRAITNFALTDFAISADELTLYYSNYPDPDVYVSTRSSRYAPFDVGRFVTTVNTDGPDIPLYVSPDDCSLYLRAGAVESTHENDIWIARRSQASTR